MLHELQHFYILKIEEKNISELVPFHRQDPPTLHLWWGQHLAFHQIVTPATVHMLTIRSSTPARGCKVSRRDTSLQPPE